MSNGSKSQFLWIRCGTKLKAHTVDLIFRTMHHTTIECVSFVSDRPLPLLRVYLILMAKDWDWIKVSFDSQRKHCLAPGNFSTCYTERMYFLWNTCYEWGVKPVRSDQSSRCGIWDGEGWPCLIAEDAGGKSALTKQVGNVFWRMRLCAFFNYAILRKIENGPSTVGFILFYFFWANSYFL